MRSRMPTAASIREPAGSISTCARPTRRRRPAWTELGTEYVSGAALGPDGYLLKLGFVPLPADDMLEALTLASTLRPVLREALPE